MTQQDTPFAPFIPQTSAPQPPAPPASDEKPAKAKRKGGSKKKAASAAAPPASPEPRQRRKSGKRQQPKYDLQTILRVASTLKEADQKVFEKLLGELSAMPKGSRGRIMAALGEVFG